MRHGLFVAPFEQLAEPAVVVDLARAAELNGWAGIFLWDHLLRPVEQTEVIGDPWITLAAIAASTSRIRLGTMVTPITRRRPQRLARETIAVDRLSNGRLILGLGLGVDSGGELSRFGEEVDAVIRGERLEEGAQLLLALWSGEQVNFAGRHFQADGVRFLPTAIQRPHPPLWFGARGSATRPVRRAARLGDGLHAIEVDAEGLRKMTELVIAERGSLDGFEIAVNVEPGTAGDEWAGSPVDWMMHAFEPTVAAAEVLAVIEAGPPR